MSVTGLAWHVTSLVTMFGMTDKKDLEIAVLGGGCFWCLEAVFNQQPGVAKVVSGYAGGQVPDPSYEAVCTGATGHAEVVEITFDPETISFEALLDIFWRAHDPTTLNRQGNDIGTQYRSVIYHQGEKQKELAEASLQQAQASVSAPIVTEIAPLDVFYPAEAYHQDYYKNHPTQGYCSFVIRPKLVKLGLQA